MSASMQDDTLLRMRATDAGFDRSLPPQGPWLVFTAAGNLATVWLRDDVQSHVVAVAPASVALEIGSLYGILPYVGELPLGASAGWSCQGDVALDALCRRIAILGQILPDQPLRQFEQEVETELAAEGNARTTERIAEVRQRVGQNIYRYLLMRYWNGRCALTGVSEPLLLRASHAKPWKDCSDAERLDVHNGLLLAIHIDTAFDAGLITIGEGGEVIPSTKLGQIERRVLGVADVTLSRPLIDAHQPYFAWHRRHVFQS